MKTVEIITHCYAMKDWRYSAALCYQLSSLFRNRDCNCNLFVKICYCPDDALVEKVLDCFYDILNINTLPQPLDELGRRSIGRNRAAKDTMADVVWFADADYLFGQGSLDALAEFPWNGAETLIYPKTVQIQNSHEEGDKLLEICRNPCFVSDSINPGGFKPIHYSRAIGGCQIVEGDFARKYGYLDGNGKYQAPTSRPFGNKGRGTHTPEDVVYRRFCQEHGLSRAVDIPNIFRIRHSEGIPHVQADQK